MPRTPNFESIERNSTEDLLHNDDVLGYQCSPQRSGTSTEEKRFQDALSPISEPGNSSCLRSPNQDLAPREHEWAKPSPEISDKGLNREQSLLFSNLQPSYLELRPSYIETPSFYIVIAVDLTNCIFDTGSREGDPRT